MDIEPLTEEIIWQAIVSGHRTWSAEIEKRLDVKIEVVQTGYGHILEHGKIIGIPSCVSAAKAEMHECEEHVELMYYSIMLLQRDPIRRGVGYRAKVDLCGRSPWQAIKENGLECIDVVLIGPVVHAAAMLAEDPRLYAAAKTRALYAHDLDKWTPHVLNVLARADALRAAKAIEGVLTSRE